MTTLCRPVLLASCLLASVASGCSGAGKGDGGGAPAAPTDGPRPPAAGTLAVDLSVAQSGLDLEGPGDAFAAASTAPRGNYLEASEEIGAVSADLAAPLALPVAALRAAGAVTAQQAADGTWVRSFDLGHAGRLWTVNLVASDLGAGAAGWSLRVTSKVVDPAGCCVDFELATGDTAQGPTAGTWHVNDVTTPSPPTRLFDVVFAVPGSDQKTLTFTVGPERPPAVRLGGGSVVAYKTQGDAITLDVQDVSTSGQQTLAWSRASKAGSLVGSDGAKVCWDTAARQNADVACP